MDIVLIPGLWLDGSSWNGVVPVLEAAGHRCHSITLPGMGEADVPPADVTLADCIAAVTGIIDAAEGSVLLVGHSAGCGLAHLVADARPDRIARIVHIGGFPVTPGEPVVGGIPTVDGSIPFPGFDAFEDADLTDLDEATRDAFAAAAIASPACFAHEPVALTDPRRLTVPATAICTEYSASDLVDWVEEVPEQLVELDALAHLDFIDLPTGHWPQFTRAAELAVLLAELAEATRIDEQGRLEPPLAAGEARTVLGYLDYQRATLEWKCRGLDTEGLAATTASSSLTLGGLLKHMALVEEHWFSAWLHGGGLGAPWDAVDWEAEPDWDFTSASGERPDDLRDQWRRRVRRSRALVAAALAEDGMARLSDGSREGVRHQLRWILLHMIEEYARHNGHADLLREAVDGQTGE